MSDVNPCFSEDIWFEIFKNLPVKTLGKCRCVCKLWHSLIVSPSFIAAHLMYYTRNDTNSLLLYRKTNEQYLFFLDSGSIPLQAYHTSVYVTLKQCNYFVGSIHGLLCLSYRRYLGPRRQIMLWNPFLSKMINLPTSMVATCKSRNLTSVLGFAYNDFKNDHRVVKISFSRVKSDNNEFSPFVEVYSVLDRIWRTIPADYLIDNSIHWVSSSHCFVNGVIHWLTWDNGIDSSIGEWILLFDVVEETFRMIKIPEALLLKKRSADTIGIFEYKSELSVSHCEYDEYGFFQIGFCKIWVKEEVSWCMILSVSVGIHIFTGPVEYLGRNGNLFGFARRSNDKMLLFTDTRTDFTFSELGHRQDKSTKFNKTLYSGKNLRQMSLCLQIMAFP
ncbi:F-box/kelch-repeat protein At3g23880-like [Silene latifolia]|uniref:F-box/kelch-repeat protein At3g23880-like n=1 Tax=Silene latifolia TaxID=37657 RepID=UPI003D7843C8